MSYDINLLDPVVGGPIEFDSPHQMCGGTYQVGGSTQAHLNVTWNYAPHFVRAFGTIDGIRSIYHMTGAESLPVLENAIARLGNDKDPDYWKPTEGNAKAVLFQLRAMALMRPDGVWDGD